MKALSGLIFGILFVQMLSAEDTTHPPILRLNTGGHSDAVTKVLFSSDDKQLISVSTDNTIRVWDLVRGEPIRALRLPLAADFDMKLYTASLAPDGNTLAVGGMGPLPSKIYVLSLATGNIEQVLDGHDRVFALSFSPDGKVLSSGGLDNVIKIWSRVNGTLSQVLRGHTGGVHALAFSPDSKKLVSASFDKTGRIWSTDTWQTDSVLSGSERECFCAAWSPDGKIVAIGSDDRSVRLWSNNGSLLNQFSNLRGEVKALAFTPNSSELLAGFSSTLLSSACILSPLNGKERIAVEGSKFGVWTAAISQDGTLAASAGTGPTDEIRVWRTDDGSIVQHLVGQGRKPYAVGWSSDSDVIAWGETPMPRNSVVPSPLERSFGVRELAFHSPPNSSFQRAERGRDDLAITRSGPASLDVKRGAIKIAELKLPPGLVNTWTLAPENRVVVGETFGLHLFDLQSGKELPGFANYNRYIFDAAVSPDGRYLLSASSDQTLRIWDLQNCKQLLALFFTANDWIAWTPEGYYAASPGGERLVGWHVNNGMDKMATFYPAAQFRDSLYRPDVIKRLLEAGSLSKALELADAERGKKTTVADVAEVLPPFVVITSADQAKIETSESTIDLRFLAKPVGKHSITGVKLLLDGRPYPGNEFAKQFDPPQMTEIRQAWKVKLEPGSHTLAIQAESAVSKAVSDPVEVFSGTRGVARTGTTSSDPAVQKQMLPNLYVLAIGISQYPDKLKLEYAAKDAEAIAKTYGKNSLALFNKVEVKLLTDQQATRRDILQGLTWLRKQMTQNDVAVISFAGHGAKDSDGTFYLVPVDGDLDDLLATAVPGNQIKSTLAGIPGKFILLLDACHSGAVDGERRRAGDSLTDDLVRDLVTDDYGVIVMCSAMGREFALESPTVEHGFFTLALVEGLSGKADYNQDSVIHLNEIDLYVTDRVKALSDGKQHPVTARPTSIRSFPLTKP